MEKQTFILFTENKSLVDKLSDEQAGKLIKAVFQYECDETFPDFSDDLALSLVFDVMKRQLDYSREKYETIREKRKEAINKRWQNTKNSSNTAKNTNDIQNIQTDTNVYKCIDKNTNEYKSIQTDTNAYYTVTDTDTDTDTDTVTDTVSPYGDKNNIREKLSDDNFSLSGESPDTETPQPKKAPQKVREIVDMYNTICTSLPKIKHISGARAKAVNARLKVYDTDAFRTLFEKAQSSDFLRGSNKNNWAADFDWLIRDTNFAKVLDGKYDNIREVNGQGQYTGTGKPSLWENQMQMLAEYRNKALKEGSG